MTLDINGNSYFYKNNMQKKKKDENSDNPDESNHNNEDSSDKKKNSAFDKKSAEASSLELIGMQNALMINQESLVHKASDTNIKTGNSGDNVHENNKNSSVTNNVNDIADKPKIDFNDADLNVNSDDKIATDKSNENVQALNNISELSLANSDSIVNSEDDILSKVKNYENLGIVRNSDGTFSIRNNPFGKFTKSTIEDYINKYIIPSSSNTWVNGYSQIYTVNSQKLFLIKVTTKDGVRAFRGNILENGIKYTIFYGVTADGKPDADNIIKKIKTLTSLMQ